MKKIISALLICMLAAVCLFTGCSKAKGLKVKDSSGNDRVLVTDENGNNIAFFAYCIEFSGINIGN